jgi:hypothetical protein
LKRVGAVSGFIKKSNGFFVILVFSEISQNYFYIEKVMDRVHASRDHDCLSVHGGLTILVRHDCSGAQEVVVIAWKERRGRGCSHQWRHLEVDLRR